MARGSHAWDDDVSEIMRNGIYADVFGDSYRYVYCERTGCDAIKVIAATASRDVLGYVFTGEPRLPMQKKEPCAGEDTNFSARKSSRRRA